MGDNQKIVLLTLQLQDDGFQADCQIVVRLQIRQFMFTLGRNLVSFLPPHEGSGDGTGQAHACAPLQGIGRGS
jgi:hypothetical protein